MIGPDPMPPLFYIIGPSGAGKDTLIAGARRRIATSEKLLFAHRYIPRPADTGSENHIALELNDFAARATAGLFALDWESHDFRYGIGIEIRHWMAAGFAVAVNGSRGYLETAAQRFPSLVPILVTASIPVLAKRLAARGRESAEAIQARLERNNIVAPAIHPALHIIENEKNVEDGIAALSRTLTMQSDA